VTIHYASSIDDVLNIALPKSTTEERQDDVIREQVIEHANA
jgi:hypothetical protein